jgi:membrane protease YdiL (CAAX protease family)
MAWFVSVAAMGARASAAPDDGAAGSAGIPLLPIAVLATAAVLAVVAHRRRWLVLGDRPGMAWMAEPLHLMAMCVAVWLVGGVSTLVAARALGLGSTIDPAALTLREASIVAITAMGSGAAVAVGLIWWMRRRGLVPMARLPLARAAGMGVLALAAWWPALACAGWVAGQLQRIATGIEPPAIGHSTLEQMVQGTRDAWWWLMGLNAVLVAPMLEECIYRGFVQQALRRAGLGAWPSILLAAVIFTLMHVGSVPAAARAASLASLAVLACCFGWLAERTGSLVAPVAAHVAFNAGNLLVATLGATDDAAGSP